MKKEIYEIRGMGCGNCAVKIQTKIRKMDGVKEANVDLMKAQLEVEFSEDKVSKAHFRKAIKELGYELI